MADKRSNGGDGYSHHDLAHTLGALGPGGMTSIGFDDYERLWGVQPTEDELEGQRAAGKFASDNGCEHRVDHAKRRVFFHKK